MITEQATPQTLGALLRECASNAPASHRDQRQAWGFSVAGRLLSEARAGGFGDLADAILAELFSTGDADERWLAITFLPIERQVALGLAALDPNTLSDDGREELRVRKGAALVAGLLPYSPSLRSERKLSGGRALVPALLAHDLPWSVTHLDEVLGKRVDDARFELSCALSGVTRDQAAALRQALVSAPRQGAGALTDELRSALVGALDDFDATGSYRQEPTSAG
jgi:hypothetical protein